MGPARLLAATLAALVCAAFVIGVRQATSINALSARLATGHELTPTQRRSAASELSSAAFGDPGQDAQILAAELAMREHHYTHARSIARSINRAEPDNLQGWEALAAAGLVIPDHRALFHAKAEEIRLDPIDAKS